MDHRHDKWLTKELREVLVRYEIPYEKGRWEQFVKRNRRRKVYVLTWAAVGAAILLMFLLVPTQQDNDSLVVDRQIVTIELPNESALTSLPDVEPPISVKQQRLANGIKRLPERHFIQEVTKDTPVALVSLPYRFANSERLKPEPPESKENGVNENITSVHPQAAFDESVSKDERSWDFDIEVSTALTDKAYFGGGIAASYALSPKVSVRGGIAWQHLGANQYLEQPVWETDDRSLIGTERSISGIDIPISANYQFSKGLYASVGIATYVVLQESKTLVYHEKSMRPVQYFDPITGEPQYRFETVEYTSRRTSSDRDFLQPLGFVQLAMGKRIGLSTNFSIIAEPYLKIPMGQTNTPARDLFHGGLRLKVGF